MKTKLIQLIVLVLIFFTLFSKYDLNAHENFDWMINFISISIGFSVTALSVVATSNFSQVLYKKQSNQNNKTLLHELVDLFKTANLLFIFNIPLIFGYSLISREWVISKTLFAYGLTLNLLHFFDSIIWSFLFLSIYYFYKLFNLFSNFVIKSAQK